MTVVPISGRREGAADPRLTYPLDAVYCDAGHSLSELGARNHKRQCRLCYNAYSRKWRDNNEDRARELTRNHMRKVRAAQRATPLTDAWLSSP